MSLSPKKFNTKKRKVLRENKGVALIIVLWMLAGLSMFTMGVSSLVQKEAAYLSSNRDLVEGRAMGEAVTYLVLKEFSENSELIPNNFKTILKNYQNVTFGVTIIPWTGLIDINSANKETWEFLFKYVADVNGPVAAELANNVIESRENLRREINFPWESSDELLKVDKFNYFIYTKIQKYLIADSGHKNSIYLDATPPELYLLLNKFADKNIYSKNLIKSNGIRVIVQVKKNERNVNVFSDVMLRSGEKLPWVISKNGAYLETVN